MINKKIVVSLLSIAAALTVTGGAAFAAFSSQATSNNNLFSTGTLTLLLSDNDQTNQATVNASFGGTNLAPGTCTGNQTLNVRNDGTIAGTNLTIAANNSNATLAPLLRINTITFNGVAVPIPDSNGNEYGDLQDLAALGATSTSGIPASTTLNLVMDICLDTSATSAVQGQTNTVGLTFTLNQ